MDKNEGFGAHVARVLRLAKDWVSFSQSKKDPP